MIKKALILWMLTVYVSVCSLSSTGSVEDMHMCRDIGLRNIIYVGGNGPNNYTTIQEAVANSTHGDTIFVYNTSSPYYEHIVIDKSIHLVGQNKTTTIIDGGGIGDVVLFKAENITIQGFTVKHSGDNPKSDAGIESQSKKNVITGNVILQSGKYATGILLNGSSENRIEDNFISENGNEGIFLEKSTDCLIRGNVITRNGHCAIVISRSCRNIVLENTMYDNYAAVSLWPEASGNEIAWNIMHHQEYSGIGIWPGAHNNSIHHNYLSNNTLYGFIITKANGNIIANNTIWGSDEGMHLSMANRTTIKFNNFIENNNSVYFENSSLNRWKQNYWDDHPVRWPKIIRGIMRLPWNKIIVIPWVNIDWFPAPEPYDIPTVRYE